MRLRHSFKCLQRRLTPELGEIYLEDERIEAVLRRIIRTDTNCVDIGCHYGSILSRFCTLAPGGHHLAVEAIPSKVRFLRRKFPDVEVFDVALSDHTGIESFYINLNASGFSGLAPHGKGRFKQIEVACARFDDIVARDRRFDLLKVDVEGAELLVLRGATWFLARNRPAVLFECGPSGPLAFGYTSGQLYDLFVAEDYSVFFLKDALNALSPVTRADFQAALIYPFKAFNWLALPTERHLANSF